MKFNAVKAAMPGLLFCTIIGTISLYFSTVAHAPVMLVAIILGLFFHPLNAIVSLQNGIDWCAKNLLYIGVALMGLRIDFGDLSQLGFTAPALVIFALFATLVLGFFVGKALVKNDSFSILMSGAIAICGVSAAAAICAALDETKSRNQELAITVAGITILSTLTMIILPIIAHALDLSDLGSGILMGGSIHNVSQAVGAGYAMSAEAGDVTVLLKLLRVSMLLPIVIIVSVTWGKNAATPYPNMRSKIRANSPNFLIAFFILAVLSCLHVVPPVVTEIGNTAARYALIISLAAIGVKTALIDVLKVGAKPLVIMTGMTIFMTSVILGGIYIIGAA